MNAATRVDQRGLQVAAPDRGATELHVDLPDLDAEAAEKLVRRAHKRCPYSNATRGNMPVTLYVNGSELASEEPATA